MSVAQVTTSTQKTSAATSTQLSTSRRRRDRDIDEAPAHRDAAAGEAEQQRQRRARARSVSQATQSPSSAAGIAISAAPSRTRAASRPPIQAQSRGTVHVRPFDQHDRRGDDDERAERPAAEPGGQARHRDHRHADGEAGRQVGPRRRRRQARRSSAAIAPLARGEVGQRLLEMRRASKSGHSTSVNTISA